MLLETGDPQLPHPPHQGLRPQVHGAVTVGPQEDDIPGRRLTAAAAAARGRGRAQAPGPGPPAAEVAQVRPVVVLGTNQR